SGSCALKCDFKDRLLNLRKIRPILAILAVVAPFAVICLSILLSLWLSESIDQFQLADSTQLLPMILLAMILAPIMEETGWHGYGVYSLRANLRHDAGDAAARRSVVHLACAAGVDQRDLSERG